MDETRLSERSAPAVQHKEGIACAREQEVVAADIFQDDDFISEAWQ